MTVGLPNPITPNELRDLIAYTFSAGNQDHARFAEYATLGSF